MALMHVALFWLIVTMRQKLIETYQNLSVGLFGPVLILIFSIAPLATAEAQPVERRLYKVQNGGN